MAKSKTARNVSPLTIFLLYIAAAFAAVSGWRFLFPPQSIGVDILECFRIPWRLSGGILMFIELFPALACSGLVLPFGLKDHSEGGYAGTFFVGKKSFSSGFLKYLFWPVLSASLAAVLYSLLFFLVLPVATDWHYSIRDRSELFERAKLRAREKAQAREWGEASQFIEICEGIWPENREIIEMKERLVDALSSYRAALADEAENDSEPVVPGLSGDPVNAADALTLAEAAFGEERYYDAHWLASLTRRLSKEGSAENAAALTLASRAWERIAELEPNALEREKYSLFNRKRDAYLAMDTGNWVSAFYMFDELSVLTPTDPDVVKYLELCKAAVAKSAFFIDELDLTLGATRNGAVFSLPGPDNGRIVLQFDSLALLRDEAYAWGTGAVVSGADGNVRFRVRSDYAKLVPIASSDTGAFSETGSSPETGDSSETGDASNADEDGGAHPPGASTGQTALLLHALDRADESKGSAPLWSAEGVSADPLFGANQLMLPISFDNFLLLSQVRQGTETLKFRELFTAEKTFDQYGYAREAFRAEIFRRLATVLFFLPMAILALVLGWRYRAGKKPRYVYVPMLAVLPAVFYGAALFFGSLVKHIAVWLSLSVGFSTALVCLGVGAGVFFILTLVLLAAQHG